MHINENIKILIEKNTNQDVGQLSQLWDNGFSIPFEYYFFVQTKQNKIEIVFRVKIHKSF